MFFLFLYYLKLRRRLVWLWFLFFWLVFLVGSVVFVIDVFFFLEIIFSSYNYGRRKVGCDDWGVMNCSVVVGEVNIWGMFGYL